MTPRPASVIIVSRHRAEALRRCLLGLSQQDHPGFEVIVVADPAGLARAATTGLPIKPVPYDEANISAARNLGLARAAGEIVAFIDDDAVAEPTWLSRLCLAFEAPDVIAATGFVLGRNGISCQWTACEVDAEGRDHPLPPVRANYSGTHLRAVKTQGTNCAFRRDALAGIGGFDPAFRFYLDEADVNLRLAERGLTAVVPEARVHHGFAASDRRRADRVPLSLHEIGASVAVFLRRHAPHVLEQETIDTIERQRDRIARLQALGRITKTEALALATTLAQGWDDGVSRPLDQRPALPVACDFAPLPGTGPRPGRVMAGRIWHRARLEQEAAEAVGRGEIVTLFCLAPGVRAHRVQFTAAGYWMQTGGVLGRSVRTGPRIRFARFSTRLAEEIARVSDFRPIR